ncbi:MAG: methyltransferase [Pseudomonadota bacterium]
MLRTLLLGASALALAACGGEAPSEETETAAAEVEESGGDAPAAAEEAGVSASEKLDAVLAAQSEETKARYQYRHPAETLAFFGIEPGMTVVEALPGGGWYSKILIPYLGPEGALVGVDYSMDMWPLFGGFATEEFISNRANWTTTWLDTVDGWEIEDGADVDAAVFGSMPSEMAGSADAVLFIRALHNLNRFEDDGGFRTQALTDAMAVLKPGGVVGVVQHRAPAGNSDDWADGSNGYVKQDALIASFEAAGFELVDQSEINANPNDQPTEDDFVWRLPPNYGTADGDEAIMAEMDAIGETDRMTLLFRKPAE